jgi:hypothetical protein
LTALEDQNRVRLPALVCSSRRRGKYIVADIMALIIRHN